MSEHTVRKKKEGRQGAFLFMSACGPMEAEGGRKCHLMVAEEEVDEEGRFVRVVTKRSPDWELDTDSYLKEVLENAEAYNEETVAKAREGRPEALDLAEELQGMAAVAAKEK